MPAAQSRAGGSVGSIPGVGTSAGVGAWGGTFKSLLSGAPHANITKVKVATPERGEFGTPNAPPVMGMPQKGDYGLDANDALHARQEMGRARGEATTAQKGFLNPTGTSAFKNLMGLANERTAAQEGEVARGAKDASSRRGYSAGFEDSARGAQADRMAALATTGFEGAEMVRKTEGEHYGQAMDAFSKLNASYTDAQATGNTAYARDLTQTRIADAQNRLSTMDLNQRQQLAYGDSLNQARQLQAQLDEQFNKDLIDNNRYIQGQQQIAAQLAAQMAALGERAREFDVGAKQFEEGRSDAELERARLRRERGVNPTSGEHYGSANPVGRIGGAPGHTFGGLV